MQQKQFSSNLVSIKLSYLFITDDFQRTQSKTFFDNLLNKELQKNYSKNITTQILTKIVMKSNNKALIDSTYF